MHFIALPHYNFLFKASEWFDGLIDTILHVMADPGLYFFNYGFLLPHILRSLQTHAVILLPVRCTDLEHPQE